MNVFLVIPAKAGIPLFSSAGRRNGTPASAGVTLRIGR
jgi:hypothetical protein